MKTKTVKSVVLVFLMLSFGSILNAQTPTPPPAPRGPGSLHWMDFIPELTTQQRESITKLHTAMLKEILPLQNLIAEKEAHLRTLTTAEKTDQKAIDKTIDEISDLRSQIQKKRMKFWMDSRQLLTEDQRVVFDQQRLNHRKNGQGFGRHQGNRGQGYGRGNGGGYGRGGRNCRY